MKNLWRNSLLTHKQYNNSRHQSLFTRDVGFVCLYFQHSHRSSNPENKYLFRVLHKHLK